MTQQEAKKTKKFSTTKSYFKFNFKYLIKRKSTWLSPLIFFAFFLLTSTFLRVVFGTQANTLSMLQTIGSLFSIIFFAIIGITKGINIFREPTTEGVEILIVSKPLTRKQILIVKFTMFNLYGISLFISNVIVFLICAIILNINPNQYWIIGLGTPVTNWFSYLFFGTVAILLSTKFSTKLIMGVGVTGVVFLNAVTGAFNTFGPILLVGKIQSLEEELRKSPDYAKYQNPGPKLFFNDLNSETDNKRFLLAKNNSSFNNGITSNDPRQYQTSRRNIKFEDLYQAQLAKQLEEIWNRAEDSLWINQLQTFLNPTSAFSKIGNFSSESKNSTSLFSFSIINEKDFAWSAKVNTNFSSWNNGDTNYSLYGTDLSNANIYSSNEIGFWSKEKNALKELGVYSATPSQISILLKGFKQDETSTEANLTYDFINSIKEKILNLVSTKLASIQGQNDDAKKMDIIKKIKEELKTSHDFNQTFFNKFLNWNYIDLSTNSKSKDPIPGSRWIEDEEKKAEFIYYLAQIIVVNEYFDNHDNPEFIETTKKNDFKNEITKIQNFDDDPLSQKTKFFGDNFQTKIVKSSQLKMIELNGKERTPAWALSIVWLLIVLDLKAATILLFFRKDFQ